jgi:acyl-CoA synthetase (AMP-forming)/AMP-acid ligase II
MNLLLPFLGQAESWSMRRAIVDPRGRSASFGDLARRSAALATAWRNAGIAAGDRVLVAMPLGIDLYAAIAGLWRLGAVIVFPEPALGLAGLRHAAAATQPKAYLSSGWYRALRFLLPELRRAPLHLDTFGAPGPGDQCFAAGDGHPALISFTSGSTGKPKGILRSHGFLAAQNAAVARFLAPKHDGTVDLVAFPVFVIANLGLGITSVLPNWRLTRQDRADMGSLLRWINDNGVRRVLAPPAICELIAASPSSLELDAIFTGGGPVFPDLLLKLAQKLPRADIVSVYGSTEAEPIAHQSVAEVSSADWAGMRNGAGLLAGAPVAEIRLRLIDDEIVVTGTHVNKSYLDGVGDAQAKPLIEGEIWHRTGDAGRIDGRGRLWLLGRRDAGAGGRYPFQVEAMARLWPGVRRAALIPGATPLLAVEGDAAHASAWHREAEQIDGLRVVEMLIPLDRRHRSKVDYVSLARQAARTMADMR